MLTLKTLRHTKQVKYFLSVSLIATLTRRNPEDSGTFQAFTCGICHAIDVEQVSYSVSCSPDRFNLDDAARQSRGSLQ